MAAQTEEQTVPAITYFPNNRDPTSGPNQMACNQTIPLPIKQRGKCQKQNSPCCSPKLNPQGYQDILKAWPWKALSVHALGPVSHCKLNHAYRPHGEKWRRSGLLTKCVHAPVCHCRHNKNGFILQQKQTQTQKEGDLLKFLCCFWFLCLEMFEQRFLMSHWFPKSKTTKWVTSIHLFDIKQNLDAAFKNICALNVWPYLNEHVLGISVEVESDVFFWITESGATRACLHAIVIKAWKHQ